MICAKVAECGLQSANATAKCVCHSYKMIVPSEWISTRNKYRYIDTNVNYTSRTQPLLDILCSTAVADDFAVNGATRNDRWMARDFRQ